MRLVTFLERARSGLGSRLGALSADGQRVVDLVAAARLQHGTAPAPLHDMLHLLDAGQAAMDQARAVLAWAEANQPSGAIHAQADVLLRAPLPRPRSIRDCMAFERHVIQCMRAVARRRCPPVASLDAWLERCLGRGLLRPPAVWYERPIYYKGNPASVVGPDVEVRWPSYTSQLDYELEFAVIIGRKGRDIPAAHAAEHIAGYTIFNDFSARDVQGREMAGHLGPAKGKDFDTGNVLGPSLVTPEEVPDPYALAMVARVNGQEWSRGRSDGMTHRFDALIAFISRDETLHPGDVIGSGAVGNGCGLELDRWIKPGDVIELEVERLGMLRNRVVAATQAVG